MHRYVSSGLREGSSTSGCVSIASGAIGEAVATTKPPFGICAGTGVAGAGVLAAGVAEAGRDIEAPICARGVPGMEVPFTMLESCLSIWTSAVVSFVIFGFCWV